jgi:hypothetical protein
MNYYNITIKQNQIIYKIKSSKIQKNKNMYYYPESNRISADYLEEMITDHRRDKA